MQINTHPRSPLSRFLAIATVVVALVLVLGACSSSSKSSSKSGGSTSGADITIKDFSFTTKSVKAGATVTIHNNGPSTHTVTSDDGKFDVSVDSGKDATFTAPATAGSYKFHCSIHSSMTSTLTVT